MCKTLKISFDFDCTLGETHIQELVKLLIAVGTDVWVLTSRQDDKEIGHCGFNMDLYRICDKLGIPKHKVIYTNGALKWGEYCRMGFDMHFDDMWDEVEEINKNGGKAFLVDMRIKDVLHLMNYGEIDKLKNEE
jgi:hypothetical protein